MRMVVALVVAVAPVLAEAQAPRTPVARPKPRPAPKATPTPEPAWIIAERACEAKDVQACFDLASMYWDGKVTGRSDARKGAEAFKKALDIDKDKAVASQQKACDGGDVNGCFNLGLMYDNGRGVAKDEAKAAQFYQKGCDGGNARGCNSLGVRYDNGRGVAKDEAKAVQFYQKGCDGGDADGCTNLGFMHDNGRGVAKDEVSAVQFYQKGCDGGDAQGCTNLGFMYGNGRGVAKDEVSAVQFYQKGCDGGDAQGCTNLGICNANGQGVAKDEAKAAQLYEKGCDGGNAGGCTNLRLSYDRLCTKADGATCFAAGKWGEAVTLRGLPKDAQEPPFGRWFDLACWSGLPEACVSAAVACQDSDPLRARFLLEKGCDGGSIQACKNLGAYYGLGESVVRDEAKAIGLFWRACDGGDTSGCEAFKAFTGKQSQPPAAKARPAGLGTLRGVLRPLPHPYPHSMGGAKPDYPPDTPPSGVGLTLCRLDPPKPRGEFVPCQHPALFGPEGKRSGTAWVGQHYVVAAELADIDPVTTDASGAFVFTGVPPGDYAIAAVRDSAPCESVALWTSETQHKKQTINETLPARYRIEGQRKDINVGEVQITLPGQLSTRRAFRGLAQSFNELRKETPHEPCW